MSIRSLEDLSDSLSSDLAWRKKELSDLKALIETRSFSPSKHRALLRSGVTILYAHWEGFVKKAACSYLEFVSMQRLPYKELSSNFIALAMKVRLSEAVKTNKATIFTGVAEFFLTELDQRSSIPYKDTIKTGSNLSSANFKEIICVLGLDYSAYEMKQVLIDEKLLARRNSIAHGEYLLLDLSDYLELHSQVIGMIELLRNQIDNCAALKQYCRNKDSS
jgi:MAE_28990/MAE_18760-like HEPN